MDLFNHFFKLIFTYTVWHFGNENKTSHVRYDCLVDVRILLMQSHVFF